MINKIISSVDKNYWLKSSDTVSLEKTYQNSKFNNPKFLSQLLKYHGYKPLGTTINQSNVPIPTCFKLMTVFLTRLFLPPLFLIFSY